MKNNTLTPEERWAIKTLGHPLYTEEFIEDWLSRESANVFTNAPVALQQMGVNGFMDAVRRLTRQEVRHAIYREIDDEYKYDDIRLRLGEMDEEQLHGKSIEELSKDRQFLSDVLYRWNKSLSWCDTSHDVYWETCDYSIDEVLKGGVND